MESGNIMAMFSLAGQDSFNFFKHDFTNHAPAVWEKAPFALRKLADKFATASSWSTFSTSCCYTFVTCSTNK
jgi:hypothetical protein